MNRIRKAVIPIAGQGIRMMPASRAVRKALFPIVDDLGQVRPVLQMIIEEALNAEIEEIGLVIAPEDKALLSAYFSRLPGPLKKVIGDRKDILERAEFPGRISDRLTLIDQDHPNGLGDAVLCTESWVDGDPFLVMLGDHLYLSLEKRSCARQLLDACADLEAPVSGLIRKSAEAIGHFGTVSGRPDPRSKGLYTLDAVVEKPDIDLARDRLRVAGLPKDTFLCWFGLHAMRPEIFDCLARMKRDGAAGGEELQLTGAQAMLSSQSTAYGLEINGAHFDTGSPKGYVEAVTAFADPAEF